MYGCGKAGGKAGCEEMRGLAKFFSVMKNVGVVGGDGVCRRLAAVRVSEWFGDKRTVIGTYEMGRLPWVGLLCLLQTGHLCHRAR